MFTARPALFTLALLDVLLALAFARIPSPRIGGRATGRYDSGERPVAVRVVAGSARLSDVTREVRFGALTVTARAGFAVERPRVEIVRAVPRARVAFETEREPEVSALRVVERDGVLALEDHRGFVARLASRDLAVLDPQRPRGTVLVERAGLGGFALGVLALAGAHVLALALVRSLRTKDASDLVTRLAAMITVFFAGSVVFAVWELGASSQR